MTFLYTKIKREIPDEVKQWLEEEVAEQEERYKKIVAEMEAIDETREQWYEEFFDRLKKYGFNRDGDQRVIIPDDELPVKPEGKHKVVY